jgi:hypothetical protein
MLHNILELSSNQLIDKNKNLLNKRDFNKFMLIENKKAIMNEKLNDYMLETDNKNKIICKNKNRRKDLSDKILKMKINQISFTGNILNIKSQVEEYIKKLNRYTKEMSDLQKEIVVEFNIIKESKKKFDNETLSSVMEVEIFENKMEETQRKKVDAKDGKWKKFLKRVALLPDDILCEIQSYFMYEVKAVLLVQKYDPLKLFHSFNKYLLNKFIYHIYKKYYHSTTHQNLKMKMTTIWKALYKDNFIIEEKKYSIPPLNKLRTFVQYLFILFHEYEHPQYCFELYRAIIILKKKLDKPMIQPFEFGLR